jgi:hypothetical protein
MTTTFSVSRDDIIKAALRKLGVLSQGESPTTDQITEASFALNTMVKAWEADGMPLWAITKLAIPLTLNVNVYDIGPTKTIVNDKPLKVIQAWIRDTASNVDVPMRILTKEEYSVLGNKTSSGKPIQIYYEPLIDYGNLYVFPTPDSNSVSYNTIYITYQRPFADINASSDVPDFPQEWYDAVIYGLALRLAPDYGIPQESRVLLGREAEAIKQMALSFGTEEGSLYFQREERGW